MPTARTKSKALPRADFPEQVGVSSKAISELLDDFERSGIELHSIMILRHGKVAFETWRDPYAPDIPHTMYSVSKSFTSIAIGFAIDEGLLTLDTKVIDIFPEYRPQKYDENLEKLTVFHLLTMTADRLLDYSSDKHRVLHKCRTFAIIDYLWNRTSHIDINYIELSFRKSLRYICHDIRV